MDLSIVIPALNEATKIAGDVAAAKRFLAEAQLTGEVIVVDDGSTDATAELAAEAIGDGGRVIRLGTNRGKGAAVREGVVGSCGDYVLFADAGLCTPLADLLPGLEMLRRGECDIAHGSRRLARSRLVRAQGLRRRALSAFFRFVSRVYLPVPTHLTDTQCGFKLYRGEVARELYGKCRTSGFMFDLEIILRAAKKGYHIKEFAISWTCDPDSRLRPSGTAFRTLGELRKIRRMLEAEPREEAENAAPAAESGLADPHR